MPGPDPGNALLGLDRRLLIAMRTRGHDPRLEHALTTYARLGEHAAGWIALGLAGAALDGDPARSSRWLHGCATVVAAYGLNYAVKLAVRRPRPELPQLPPLSSTVSRLSFPSAHATTSFAAAAAYRGLAPGRPLYAAAALFAITRPYLGVHYPSDVIAGAALGTAVARVLASRETGTPTCR